MSWSELGSVNVTFDWQFIDTPSVGDEVFRIRQAFPTEIGGYAVIAQAYGSLNEFYGYRRIYPNNNQDQILELPIPQDFKSAGNITRYLVLKLSSRAKVFNFDWQISIDAWQGSGPVSDFTLDIF